MPDMAYRQTEMGLVVRLHPDQAKKEILKYFAHAEGNATEAAAQLQVSYRNLLRWSEKLNLLDAIGGIRTTFRKHRDARVKIRIFAEPQVLGTQPILRRPKQNSLSP
jgi:hypothetical protein